MLGLIRRERRVAFFIVAGAVLGSGVLLMKDRFSSSTVADSSPSRRDELTRIRVHVAGAVWHSGVYEAKEGDRIKDVLERGVPREEADIHALNLAAPLENGQKIVVPFRPGPGSAQGAARLEQGSAGTQRISLNTASAEELEALPGIGPVKAQRIVQYRETHGGFERVEDVQLVTGIGEKTFETIKDLISVE